MWLEYAGVATVPWTIAKLEQPKRATIPTRSGIYTLVVQPGIAAHPLNAYLFYVGKAEASLRSRFAAYLDEKRRIDGRPKVYTILNQYPEHTWFCYAEFPKAGLGVVEDGFIATFLPFANTRFPARVSAIIKAAFG